MSEEPEITFDFFKAISCGNQNYLCDFHKLTYPDGKTGYKVILRSLDEKDITADIYTEGNAWKISSPAAISPMLEQKLISAIGGKSAT